ncbi:Hypothetical_protein [Hexamita inflata]|uniref:Hypothetical_protein n=1 Tax=Hexamita inflata TaxID=28002 RepID=A0AA86Q3U0_9EUKA|nr:Hypothetical protein HINF_LOCUS39141 [Hexamita inflata]
MSSFDDSRRMSLDLTLQTKNLFAGDDVFERVDNKNDFAMSMTKRKPVKPQNSILLKRKQQQQQMLDLIKYQFKHLQKLMKESKQGTQGHKVVETINVALDQLPAPPKVLQILIQESHNFVLALLGFFSCVLAGYLNTTYEFIILAWQKSWPIIKILYSIQSYLLIQSLVLVCINRYLKLNTSKIITKNEEANDSLEYVYQLMVNPSVLLNFSEKDKQNKYPKKHKLVNKIIWWAYFLFRTLQVNISSQIAILKKTWSSPGLEAFSIYIPQLYIWIYGCSIILVLFISWLRNVVFGIMKYILMYIKIINWIWITKSYMDQVSGLFNQDQPQAKASQDLINIKKIE